jgi:hypothetical protein
MFRCARSTLLGAVCTASVALAGATAQAQHWYEPGYHHDSHFDSHGGGHTYGPRYYGRGYDDHSFMHQHGFPEQRVEYRFGGFSHVDDLAYSLEKQANLLCWELYYNYQHNPGYRETYREVYEMAQVAKFIHGLEHARNRQRLKEEALRMDSLFHHIERDMASWTAHHHRRVGQGGLTSKLEVFEETLHHLMDDVGVRSPAALDSGRDLSDTPPPALPAPALTAPGTLPSSDFQRLD